jgi:putative ABC transport system permease protein
MIQHYLKIALRNFWKHKTFSFLNISGLAIGMAAVLILGLWIENQLSTDQFHDKKATIFKLYTNSQQDGQIRTSASIAAPVAMQLSSRFPEIKQATRMIERSGSIHSGDKVLHAFGNTVDPSFLDMFSFPLLSGEKNSFNGASAIFISAKLAQALFGNESALGKIVTIDSTTNLIVKGVFKELPDNTQFKFDYLLPWESLQTSDFDNSSWNNVVPAFVEINPNADIDALNNQLTRYLSQGNRAPTEQQSIFLYPLSKVWLYGHFENGKPAGGVMDLVRIIAIIGMVILLIACINFMNLSTARSLQRSKEVGVRKVMGGKKQSLIWQFITEAIVFSLFAGLLAIAIASFVLPSFNLLTEKNLHIKFDSLLFWIAFFGFVLVTGLLAGSYPAFYLSSFNPINALKGMIETRNRTIKPGKILFVFQFTIAIILINFTILVQKQMDHLKSRQSGFGQESLVFHRLTPSLLQHHTAVIDDLLKLKNVNTITVSNTPITRGGERSEEIQWEGMNAAEKTEFDIRTTAGDFVTTNSLSLLEGRDIDFTQFPGDSNSCLINESASNLMQLKQPIGKTLKYNHQSLMIVGLIKDFITTSPLQAIDPVIIRGSKINGFLSIKINRDIPFASAIQEITAVLKKYNPDYVTELQFADDDYGKKIKGLRLTGILTDIFAFIAIFISCLGLLGLVMYIAETRAKEISIRKVFGAGLYNVTSLLSKSFVKLVLLSIAIGSPPAWLLMNAFLRPIYYRTPISVFILLEAGFIALLVTIATICSQTVRIGLTNPTRYLRNDG